MKAGGGFNHGERVDRENGVIISESSRDECSPSVDAVGRRMMWTDPVTQFIGV